MSWFIGKHPRRKQLNRQFIFYGVVLVLVAIMLYLTKRSYMAP